ncbi:MAG TPA: ComEC/Rec2 family competence protein, partial [Caulobacteraceae bacterium]
MTAQAARWRLWAPVFLGMGGALYFGLRFEPAAWPAWIAAVLATAAAILLSRRNFTGAARAVALVLCLVLGFAVTKARADRVAGPIALAGMRPTMVEGWVLDVDSPGANGPRVLLATTRIDGLAPEVTPVRMRLTVKGEAPAPGIAIRAFALVNPPPQPASPGAFDFARGAWFEGVGAVAFALSPAREAYLQRPPWRLQMVMRLNAMRYGLAQRVRGAMGGGEAGAVGAAMVTGHEAWITPETTQAMRDSGLAHILSISGLHMAIVGGFAFFAVRLGVAAFPWLALRVPGKKVAAVAGAVAVGVYLLASGAPAPAERSAIVAWAAFAAILLDRRALSMNALALAALVVLLRRPESVVQAGFQMSFAATAGLVALAEVWPARSKEINAPWPIVAVQRLAWWAGVAIMVSLVAGLATGPFAMQHFNRVAMYGLGANIAVEPISSLLMMPALALGAMLTPLGLGEPFLILARWGVEAMLAIGRFFGELPGAVRVVASAPAAALPVSFLGVLFLCLWRGPLRWLGLPFAAAVLLWPRPIPPDIWIGAEGNNAALRAGEQAIIVRPEVRQFATDLWTRRYALSPAASTTQ